MNMNIRTNELFSIIDDKLHTSMVNAHISDALINLRNATLDRNCFSYVQKKEEQSEFLSLLIVSEIHLQSLNTSKSKTCEWSPKY